MPASQSPLADAARFFALLASASATISMAPFASAQDPQPARVTIETNAACRLSVNGNADDKPLLPFEPRIIDAKPGDLSLECVSTTVPTVTVKQSITAAAAAKPATVALDVAAPVVKASCSGQPSTFADLGGGILRHCVTGLDWTQSDSGAGGLVFKDASALCAKRGKGWEMPMPDEMAELIDRSGKSQTACGKHTCYVSKNFRLTGPIFWSNQKTHEGMHMGVNLILGGRHPISDAENNDYHALCLRRAG